MLAPKVVELSVPAGIPERFALDLPIDGTRRSLDLMRTSVRGPRFQVLVVAADGELVPHPVLPPTTYVGLVQGMPDSRVRAWISEAGIHAYVDVRDGSAPLRIEPLGAVREPGDSALHVIGRRAEPILVDCEGVDGTLPLRHGRFAAPGLPQSGSSSSLSVAVQEVELACDTTYEFFQQHGSVSAVLAHIQASVHLSNLAFEDAIGVTHVLGTIIIRDDIDDPYTSGGLSEFRDYWNANYSGFGTESFIHRDSALIFGNNGPGAAYYKKVCNLGSGYAQVPGGIDVFHQAHIVTHELAHLLGALDFSGGVMDYGVTLLYFGPAAIAQMSSHLATVGCLSSGTVSRETPELTSVTPQSVAVLPYQQQALSILGTGFLDVLSITYADVERYLPTFQVVSDTEITYVPPMPTALGSVRLSASGPGGRSNEITVNWVETFPPLIDGTAFSTYFGGEWQFVARAGHTAEVRWALSNATTAIGEWNVLRFHTVKHTGPLNDVGFGSFSEAIPSAYIGQTLYVQIVTYDAGVISGASNILAHPITE